MPAHEASETQTGRKIPNHTDPILQHAAEKAGCNLKCIYYDRSIQSLMSADSIRPVITDRRRKYEIIAVFSTGLGKFIFMDFLQWKFPFIITAMVAWTVYVIYRSKTAKHILPYWGFRTDNFGRVTRRMLPFGLITLAAFFVVGYLQHTINLTWHIFPILLLYPLWGVIQQFLVIGLVAGNLQDMQHNTPRPTGIIVLTAVLFGLLHYPHWWLVIGTFVLALFYGFVYLKDRNVYVMGLFHGWLGGLFFYTVVNRDPFAEVFGKLLQQP